MEPSTVLITDLAQALAASMMSEVQFRGVFDPQILSYLQALLAGALAMWS
jgi:hypothetical protein